MAGSGDMIYLIIPLPLVTARVLPAFSSRFKCYYGRGVRLHHCQVACTRLEKGLHFPLKCYRA